MTPINALNNAVCSATGLTPQEVAVSVGRFDDRSTWHVRFYVTASPAQEAAAADILANYDPVAASAVSEAESNNYRAMIRRRARNLAIEHDDEIGALLLLKSIGE